MIKAVIIDDEQNAIETISFLLEDFNSMIQVVGIAQSVYGGIEMINQLKPDLVFLDIELKDGIGFEVAEKTSHIDYKLVFTTAYDQYAVKAFKVRAQDYLLKPIDIDEFNKTVERCIHEFESFTRKSAPTLEDKIRIPDVDGYNLISTSEILFLEADSNYTRIHTSKAKSFILSKTLKEFEQKLDPSVFMRVHNSYMVNINEIMLLSRGEPSFLTMSDGSIVPVSRSRKGALQNLFEKK